MVSPARRSLQRRQELRSRDAAHLEGFCGSSELRRLLETRSHALYPDQTKGSESKRGGLVGSGGCLRSDEDLRTPREKRSRSFELSCRRPVESRRLGTRLGQVAWRHSFWQRYL